MLAWKPYTAVKVVTRWPVIVTLSSFRIIRKDGMVSKHSFYSCGPCLVLEVEIVLHAKASAMKHKALVGQFVHEKSL